MDAIFVFGDKAARDSEGRLYTGTSFSQEIFDRYLEHFDHLTLLMRKAPIDPDDRESLGRMNLLTDERISIVFLPDTLASAKDFLDPTVRREIKQTIETEVEKGCAVILRMHSYYSYIAARICVKRGIPYLAEAVGCPWSSLSHHSLKGKMLAPASALQMKYCMRHAAYAVYVTKHFLQGRYPTDGKGASVSDVELLPPEEAVLQKRFRKIQSLKDDPNRKLLIGTSGSVQVAYKGQRFVFRALAKLRARGIDRFEYHLAGGGDDRVLRDLAAKLGIEDLVVFEGMMPHDRIYGWLDELDLYIQPSEVEGLSRALIEAMSRGLPAFASDIGGNPELLEPSCIHKCGAVSEIEKELKDLTPERMQAMAEKNFRTAEGYEKLRLQKKRRRVLSEFAGEAEAFYKRGDRTGGK